jgi:hypothetical protein
VFPIQSRIVEGYRDKRTSQLHHVTIRLITPKQAPSAGSGHTRLDFLYFNHPIPHPVFRALSAGVEQKPLPMTGSLARSLAGPYYPSVARTLKDMSTWTELIGRAQLRSFVDDDGHFWLEQNAAKKTKWAKLAREGHGVAWEFAGRGGPYTGRMLIKRTLQSGLSRPHEWSSIDALEEVLDLAEELGRVSCSVFRTILVLCTLSTLATRLHSPGPVRQICKMDSYSINLTAYRS